MPVGGVRRAIPGEYTCVSQNHKKADRYIFQIKHGKILKDVRQRFAVGEYDLLHAHSLFSNGYIAYRLHEEYGIPYVVAVRNSDVNTFFRYMIHLRPMALKILSKASRIVFLSIAYRDRVFDKYIPRDKREELLAKTVIIPNGINDFWFRSKAVPKKKPDRSAVTLVYAGDINKNKNILTVLKVCALLQEAGIRTEYHVIGDIRSKAVFKKIQKAPFAHYRPRMKPEELAEQYRNSDIFVMPSIFETFGLVYAEALTQGLPVIYTRGQGFDRQFDEGYVGYSVPAKDPEQIRDAILRVVREYERLSANALDGCAKFSWSDICGVYSREYEKILKGGKGESGNA